MKKDVENVDPERRLVEIAPLEVAPINKCIAFKPVLADIIIQKFVYHLPFYRIIKKYKVMGIVISDSTMGVWYAAVCEKLKILYNRLKAEALSCDYIQADESTVPVIDNEKSKTRKGYMWCIRDVLGGAVFFHYDLRSRSTRIATALLKVFKGAIQSDGYDVYEHFDGLEDKTMIGCWAHARRKFVEAKSENDPRLQRPWSISETFITSRLWPKRSEWIRNKEWSSAKRKPILKYVGSRNGWRQPIMAAHWDR